MTPPEAALPTLNLATDASAGRPGASASRLRQRFEADFNLQAYKYLRTQNSAVHFRSVRGREGRFETVDGRPCAMFASNDYLGLRWDPRTMEAACDAVRQYGSGAGGSRLIAGSVSLHHELEEEIADLIGREDVCLFTTGYQANVGAMGALLQAGDQAFCDAGVHASLIDGCRLAGARMRRFRRSAIEGLASRIARAGDDGLNMVVTDAIYSMEGETLPLDALVDALGETDALLHVDEAHSIAVCGPGGAGLSASGAAAARVDLVTGTLSKALGSCGGFAAGERDLIDGIRIRARSLLFSTASAPASLGAALAALRIARTEPERRERLHANSRRLRDGFAREGLNTGSSDSQIVPVYIPDPFKAAHVAKRLFDRGICCAVAVHPAVPRNQSLLRFSVTALLEPEDIDRCVAETAQIIHEMDLTAPAQEA